jgi:hypothetical protein
VPAVPALFAGPENRPRTGPGRSLTGNNGLCH